MRAVTFAIALALGIASATAAPLSDPIDAVNQFVNGMNHNDMKSAAAAYAPAVSIIDEFPPHYWQGSTAFVDWGRDFNADAAKNAITEPVVTLSKPLESSTTGDRAYLVIPATYAFKQHGKSMRESDGIMTFALLKTPGGWRIAGWAWSARQAAH